MAEVGEVTAKKASVAPNGGSHQAATAPSLSLSSYDKIQEKEQLFFQRLNEGFQFLRDLRDGKSTVQPPPPPSVLPSFLGSVAVNFIDPTTSSISTIQSATTTKPTSQQHHLYEKFTAIFQRDYNSTLTNVPYSLIRNNSNGIIESLPISTTVARSHGGGVLLPDDDAAKSAFHDYSWERPYCYVYLAACESMDHYRTKVKPSIQAFVSQLEASSKQSSLPSSRQSTTESPIRTKRRYTPQPRYVVIYIPTGDRTSAMLDNNTTSTAANNMATMSTAAVADAAAKTASGLASRLASAARQRITARNTNTTNQNTSHDNSNDFSGHSGSVHMDNTPTDDGVTNTDQQEVLVAKLGKMEREIAKRFAQDFPLGNVCTLSNLADLEWNSVIKAMGLAIAGGFQDRCHRFDDELRKLDLMRRGEARPTTTAVEDATKFHLVNFFLVKESFAFTFEQMRLPAEALLHYEELRAFLPDADEPTDISNHEDYQEFSKMALCANILEFRRVLRSQGELDHVSAIVEEYVFARELSLLFQMHKSIRIAQRFLAFYKHRFDDIAQALDDSAANNNLIVLQKQMFRYCWAFRCASELYLPSPNNNKMPFNTAFARCLCDVLDFAIQRFVWLGAEHYPETRLLFSAQVDPSSIASWGPWEQNDTEVMKSEEEQENANNKEDFLSAALGTPKSLQLHFLQLTSAIVRYNELCDRKRIAALIRTERMELLAALGFKRKAAEEIRSILRLYGQERWHFCHFSLLLRLISLQRNICSAPDYLRTLVHSFSESLTSIGPRDTVLLIHRDLEAVVNSRAAGLQGLSFSSPPLFQPSFGLDGKFTPSRQSQDRTLWKRLYTFGDKVNLSLQIVSHLPKDCVLDGVEVHLIPFQVYVAAVEDNVTLEDKDVFAKLKALTVTTLVNGTNNIDIEWSPSSSGQFILASCSLIWRGVAFRYTAKSLRRLIIRIDVVPRKPTQSIRSNPTKLISGHEQNIELIFCAGSETIEQGSIQLIGSSGLHISHGDLGKSGWFQTLEIPLQPCGPESETHIHILAKVIKINDLDDSVPPLIAKINTKYRIADPNTADGSEGTADHEMELKIPVSEKSIFSVVESNLLSYAMGCFIVAATLRCIADSPVTLKQWQLHLPSNLTQSGDLDMNEILRNEHVSHGQEIRIAFHCRCLHSTKKISDVSLSTHFENEHGKTLVETVALSIELPEDFDDRTGSCDPVLVSVASSRTELSLGDDVVLRYSFNLPKERNHEKYSYVIDFNHEHWIVRGQLAAECSSDTTAFNVEVLAVAVQPGPVSEFPSLNIIGISQQERTLISTKMVPTSNIMVVAPHEHFAVGFPTVIATKRSRIHI